MAKVLELQRLYELWLVARGHIDGIDVMLDGRTGENDDSFKAWVKYFMGYPKKWRDYQFERFGVGEREWHNGVMVVSNEEFAEIYG